MERPEPVARNYKIYRALKRMGFEGETLVQNYLYFCSLPPSSADFLLFKMLQSKDRPKKRIN